MAYYWNDWSKNTKKRSINEVFGRPTWGQDGKEPAPIASDFSELEAVQPAIDQVSISLSRIKNQRIRHEAWAIFGEFIDKWDELIGKYHQ